MKTANFARELSAVAIGVASTEENLGSRRSQTPSRNLFNSASRALAAHRENRASCDARYAESRQ